ncbi:MAG: hypothetical protein IJF07_09960 [Lachnospiraceae bacterium]|nr:hypothetical protein [Lachnospiraceae bacterium]
MSAEYKLGILGGVIIGLIIVVVLNMVSKTDNSIVCKYDERQELVRGKGFKYGYFSIMISNVMWILLSLLEVSLFCNIETAMFISIIVGVGVFACYCIWNDGYFALNENRKGLMIVFAIVGGINLYIGLMNVIQGSVLENGSLTMKSANLFCGILLFAIFIMLLLKEAKDRKEG